MNGQDRMKRQRGFGWIEAVAILVAVAVAFFAIRSVIKAVNAHDESIRTTADKAGYDRAMKELAQRDKKELEDAGVMIAALQLEKDTAAALHSEEQARLKKDHDKEVSDANRKTADLLDRVRSGELVFYDPGQQPGAGGPDLGHQAGGSGGIEGRTAAAATGGSGQALGAGLSRPATEFLLEEADRADEVARDLALCWGIARDDRVRLSKTP